MSGITLEAPAKINLALHVVGRRGDGYHLLESLAVFARFGDRVAVMAGADGFTLSGPYADAVPPGDGNLVLRAREALCRRLLRRRFPPAAIALEKNLPPASGIGGGSSDAAAALLALSRHWGLGPEERPLLAETALRLGADVAMCLAAAPLVARGIGDRLEVLDSFPALPLVLVNPGVEVATAEVFRRLEERDNAALPPLPAGRSIESLCAWLGRTRNDLETPALACAPSIAVALAALRQSGARLARMSGSGATCFGIFATMQEASAAATAIRAAHADWFVAATESRASGEDGHGGS